MRIITLIFLCLMILACSPVKTPDTNEYQLSAFSSKHWVNKLHPVSILVTAPEAVASFQTEEMLYIKKPYQLESFVKNEWSAPPADMLFPLIVKSLQKTGYFYAVASSPYNEAADYRLDTQLLTLDQSFLKKPSVVEFTVKIVLTRTNDNKVIASKIIHLMTPCASDTPYGGVVAANQASMKFTGILADFIISRINHSSVIAKK